MMVQDPEFTKNFEFHHLGYATHSVQKELVQFTAIGYIQEGPSFADPMQGVSGCFITGAGPRIELLESLPDAQILTPWLEAGIHFYHMAYLVDSMEEAMRWVVKQRARVTTPPLPSVAFSGSKIMFAMLRNRSLIELIERPLSTVSVTKEKT
jgi:methylmalonyl-CoA/ethylmalonyl-CoA epimerase